MRQTELNLSEEDRSIVEDIRSKGVHQTREVNRAHVLSCLDRGVPESQTWLCLASVVRLCGAPVPRICKEVWSWRCSM